MTLRSAAVWIAFLAAVATLDIGCGAQAVSPSRHPSREAESALRAVPPLTPDQVHGAIRVERDVIAPGGTVGFAAELLPTYGVPRDVRLFIAAPDGTESEVARWDARHFKAGSTARLEASWTVPGEAPIGLYGVSLHVTAQAGATSETGNIASFRVDPAAPTPSSKSAAQGLSVSGRHLIDGEGRMFVPRGPELVVSHVGQLGEIDAIAATGANALRMLLTIDTANQMTPAAFEQLVGRAVANRMVVWISLFTWNDQDGRAIAPAFGGGHLRQMSDYLTVWQRPWLKELVKRYDGWVVLDAMQEYHSTIQPPEKEAAVREWVDAAKQHIRFFRDQGYTQPLEIMTSFEGRDLHAIIANAEEILAADSLTVHGTKQTLFGWQAYWGTHFYRDWQGELLLGRRITATEAVKKFVATRTYPIMVGLDTVDVPGKESYAEIMPACAAHRVGWLWWEWEELKSMPHGQIVRSSKAGFAGSVKASN